MLNSDSGTISECKFLTCWSKTDRLFSRLDRELREKRLGILNISLECYIYIVVMRRRLEFHTDYDVGCDGLTDIEKSVIHSSARQSVQTLQQTCGDGESDKHYFRHNTLFSVICLTFIYPDSG